MGLNLLTKADDGKEESMTLGCVLLVIAVFLIPVTYYLRGWMLFKLWCWFVTPVWDIASPPLLQCIGVMFVITAVRGGANHLTSLEATDKSKVVTRGLMAISMQLSPILVVGVGWIVRYFIY